MEDIADLRQIENQRFGERWHDLEGFMCRHCRHQKSDRKRIRERCNEVRVAARELKVKVDGLRTSSCLDFPDESNDLRRAFLGNAYEAHLVSLHSRDSGRDVVLQQGDLRTASNERKRTQVVAPTLKPLSPRLTR
jgi:hypothetical protein